MMRLPIPEPTEHVPRYATKLGLTEDEIKRAFEIARVYRRASMPHVVAALAVYRAAKERVTMRAVAGATGCGPASICKIAARVGV